MSLWKLTIGFTISSAAIAGNAPPPSVSTIRNPNGLHRLAVLNIQPFVITCLHLSNDAECYRLRDHIHTMTEVTVAARRRSADRRAQRCHAILRRRASRHLLERLLAGPRELDSVG